MSAAMADLQGVLDALTLLDPPGGRVALVVSAKAGEGASPTARALAQSFAAQSRKPCLLIDLDVLGDGQCAALRDEGRTLGPVRDGRMGGASFLRPLGAAPGATTPSLGVRRVEGTTLFVTTLHRPPSGAASRIAISADGAYWRAARDTCALTVVDAPALARSGAGLVAARHMDAAVLVVSAQRGAARATLDAKARLELSGAAILGLVYTDADPAIARLERRARGFGAGAP